jgi:hypothetical protein
MPVAQAEETAKAQVGASGDIATAIVDCMNAIRYTNRKREPILADSELAQALAGKNLGRMGVVQVTPIRETNRIRGA